MKKNKSLLKPLLIGLIIIAAIVSLILASLSTKKPPEEASAMILFYGENCKYCKIVEQYINDNNVRAKLKFQELEVYNNKANAALMAEKAKICGIEATRGLGVPFFFDGKNCLRGDVEIVNFFKTK